MANKDPTLVWQIADGGWKDILTAHRTEIKNHWLGNFNTPKTGQINSLFLDLLGIGKLSDSWYWAGMSAKNSAAKLDEYITVRGDIAHRLNHSETVYQHWGKDYLGHITRIVGCCEKAVSAHVRALVGASPW